MLGPWNETLNVLVLDPRTAAALSLVPISSGAGGMHGMASFWTTYRVDTADDRRLDAVCLAVTFLCHHRRWHVSL
jgi:hypothetical protein